MVERYKKSSVSLIGPYTLIPLFEYDISFEYVINTSFFPERGFVASALS